MPRRVAVAVSAVAAVSTAGALAPAPARADVLLAHDRVVPGQGFDVAVRNLQRDGAPVTLPAGVNTPANELHPTLSGDGRLLAFQRDTLANVPGPENPPRYHRQIVVVDLHAGRIVTPAPFQFADALRQTPSISADARWVVNGNGPYRDGERPALTLTDLGRGLATAIEESPPPPPPSGSSGCGAASSDAAEICIPPGAVSTSSEITIAPDAVAAAPRSTTTTVLNPSVGRGAAPLLAWTRARVRHYGDGTRGASVDLRLSRTGSAGGPRTVTRSANEAFGHPAVVNDGLVAFERIPLNANGTVGDGDIWSVDEAGRINRSLPQVNSPADERQPAWTADGRYLAVLRRGADGRERALLFDFASNLLVDPAGLDLGVPPADSRPLHQSRVLQGSISIAEDPTARTETITLTAPRFACPTPKGATRPDFSRCRVIGTVSTPVGKRTTVGILARRLLGTETVLGRRVPRLGPQIRLPLGALRGRTAIRRDVGRRLAPGRYLLTLRSFGRGGRVRTLARSRVVTVR